MIKIVHWKFHNLVIPMLKIGGILYSTYHMLASALEVTPDDLRMIRNTRPDEFDGIRLGDLSAKYPSVKNVYANNKGLFGIERLRDDMHIPTEDDMLSFGFAIRSSIGKEFRKGLKELIKKHASIDVPTVQENEQLIQQLNETAEALRIEKKRTGTLENRVSALEEIIEWAKPFIEAIGSANGKGLQAQKGIKRLTEIN